jgi:hypothetical protein
MRQEIKDVDDHWGKAVHLISYLCTEPDEKIIVLPNSSSTSFTSGWYFDDTTLLHSLFDAPCHVKC